MPQREIHIPGAERCAKVSRIRLFGRRLLETFSSESRELSALRRLILKINSDPSKSTIGELRELGSLFRSLSRKGRGAPLELEVFHCLSKARVCSTDPVFRAVAETERRITDWRLREGVLQTFLNTC